MSFFEHPRIRDEVVYLQESFAKLQSISTEFPMMEHDDKLEFIEECLELLEKQKIIYTRLTLSEEEDAKEVKHQMDNLAKIFGSNGGLRPVLDSMEEKMLGFRRQLLDTND
jgi:hypothetical protein